jgi:D-arabinose 1-dehydrogenase-like Zn-dependent alcohol dehydrogenase
MSLHGIVRRENVARRMGCRTAGRRGIFGRRLWPLRALCGGDLVNCLNQARSIEGALTGDPATGDATLKFSVLAGVAAMIETVPLENAPAAYARMMAGKARLRMVLTMKP